MSTDNEFPPTPVEAMRASLFSRVFLKGKVYMINPEFQWKFMGYIVLTVVMSVGIIFLSNYIFFEQFIAKGESLGLPKDHAFFILIKEQRDAMTTIFVAVSGIISIIIGFWGLFFSHRIVGPLYRLNRFFTKASESNDEKLRPIFFRENDFFQEIPDSVNKYLAGIDRLKPASSSNNKHEGNEAPPVSSTLEEDDREAS